MIKSDDRGDTSSRQLTEYGSSLQPVMEDLRIAF
jgi:hypothetical protein